MLSNAGVNALNGLTSFLLYSLIHLLRSRQKCQCPKRAYFISTLEEVEPSGFAYDVCQCPKRAYFISTGLRGYQRQFRKSRVNALNGLTSFLPNMLGFLVNLANFGVNALNGLTSFLQYPLGTRINTGFPGSFLQVFVRIF